MKNTILNEYLKKSKHSQYQILPRRVREIVDLGKTNIRSRFEKERLDYLAKNIDFKGKTVLDIGGNTGYFSFEVLELGAKRVSYWDGNKNHAKFVAMSARRLALTDRIKVYNQYYDFKSDSSARHDIALLLNVLHHLGDDYGDKNADIEKAKASMIEQMNSMSANADTLVFQMGFNWKGDIEKPLFKNGTKKEMIDFLKKGTKNNWRVYKIGVAVRKGEKTEYRDLDDGNIKRNNSLGEFLNRPIFIFKKWTT